MALVLTRHAGETITIGSDIEVTIVAVKGSQVRVAVTAPRNVTVHRKELADQIGTGTHVEPGRHAGRKY